MDISDIPSDQMEKLASIVTMNVHINTMTHTGQLGSILANVKCPHLGLAIMDLVTAMRDRVQRVRLWGVVILDIDELTQYDGQGLCSELEVWGDTRTRYGKRLRRWAADKGWRVTWDDDDEVLVMERGIYLH